MEHDFRIIDTFQPDDSKYVDPLFRDYQDEEFIVDGRVIKAPKITAISDAKIDPKLFDRIGLDFQKTDSSYQCPVGYISGHENWCHKRQPDESEMTFYSNDQYQFPSFITKSTELKVEEINNFDGHSLNPKTGNFVKMYEPKSTYKNNRKRLNLGDSLMY